MARIKLNKVKAQGSNFPNNNTTPEFRFDSDPIASISVPPPQTWKNFPPATAINFSGNGKIKLYMGGQYISSSSTTIGETPVTNYQVTVDCAYGKYLVKYTVTDP